MKPSLIVGDIHGCFEELEELLLAANFDKQVDRLICVGDLINKGPYSFEVLNFLEKISADIAMGNHELAFLKYLESENPTQNKIFEELKAKMGKDVGFWKKKIESFFPYIEEEEFIVVHGGLVPGEHPKNTPIEVLANLRCWDGSRASSDENHHPAWYDFYKGEKVVVFGHWAKRGLIQTKNVVGLDTGCVYGRKLSALRLPEKEIIQVKAKKAYCEIQ